MGKYLPLTEYLRSRGGIAVRVTFEQIEGLCGPLPYSARRYRQWWANQRDTRGRPQAVAWTDADYRVGVANLVEGFIVFESPEYATDREGFPLDA